MTLKARAAQHMMGMTMKKQVVIAAMLTLLAAAGAQAETQTNGLSINGIGQTNGLGSNGMSLNALGTNGMSLNALTQNGINFNALTQNGISLNALGTNAITGNGISLNALGSNAITGNALYPNGVKENGAGRAISSFAVEAVILADGTVLAR